MDLHFRKIHCGICGGSVADRQNETDHLGDFHSNFGRKLKGSKKKLRYGGVIA